MITAFAHRTAEVFSRREPYLADTPGLEWLGPLGRLAWPWYVPLGTLLAVGSGVALSYVPGRSSLSVPRTSGM